VRSGTQPDPSKLADPEVPFTDLTDRLLAHSAQTMVNDPADP
jgi:hypothetical protein